MLLSPEQSAAVTTSSRTGLIDTKYRWPNKTVFYQMSQGHTRDQQLYIELAHWVIESVSCIKFVRRTKASESAYIRYYVSMAYLPYQDNDANE